jgi:hypothetical protein
LFDGDDGGCTEAGLSGLLGLGGVDENRIDRQGLAILEANERLAVHHRPFGFGLITCAVLHDHGIGGGQRHGCEDEHDNGDERFFHSGLRNQAAVTVDYTSVKPRCPFF